MLIDTGTDNILFDILVTLVMVTIGILFFVGCLGAISLIIQSVYDEFIRKHTPKIKEWLSPKSEIDRANRAKEKEIRSAEKEKEKYDKYKKLVRKQEKIDKELEQEDIWFETLRREYEDENRF